MQRTPFYRYHQDHGASFVDFAGWEMPIRYGSIIEEHQAVRESLGIFDVSHMGRIRFSGRHARRMLERLCTRRLSDMQPRQCRYSFVCNATGGVMDDVIVYRYDDHWMMVCNASNREKLLAHFEAVQGDLSVKIDDQTKATGMIALQGPNAMDFIAKFSSEVPSLKPFAFAVKNLLIVKMTISRTGYTGEDGVEIILPANTVGVALKLLDNAGGGDQIRPVGLGARDTLRLEAGMPLYGHELDEDHSPLETPFKFAINLDKAEDDTFGEPEPCIGHDALKAVADNGPDRRLVGLKLDGKRTPRQHMPIMINDEQAGEVTSGCMSPTLGHPIAMAYITADQADVGKTVDIDFGKKTLPAEIVKLPFYKRPKA